MTSPLPKDVPALFRKQSQDMSRVATRTAAPPRARFRFRTLLYPSFLFYAVSTLALNMASTRKEKQAIEEQFTAQISTLQSVIARIQARDHTLDINRELQMVNLRERDGSRTVPESVGKVDWAAIFPGWARRKQQQAADALAASGEQCI